MNLFSKLVRYLTFAVSLSGFVAIAVVLQQLRAQDKSAIPPPPVAPPEKPYAQTVAATGILEALSENVSIGVPMQGLVTAVEVKVGDAVQKGQALFTIDDREMQAQLPVLRAAVEVSKARVGVQNATLARVQDLLDRIKLVTDKRAVSVDEIKTRENDVAVAKAELQASQGEVLSAEANVKQTEMLIDRLTIRAPREGTILQVNIRAGEFAAIAPRSPAMVLGDLERLQVRADVDEQNASRIRPGQRATAYIKGVTERPLELQFVRVEPYVIPKVSLTGTSTERVDTRVLQVIYSLQRPKDPPIYVGQQVDVYIDSSVPSSAPQ